MTKLSTLCYIEKDGQYLMLHRTVKKNDVNKDKWIGVGGHFEQGEHEISDLVKYYYIELPKYRKAKADMNNKLDQWLAFIDDTDWGKIEMAEEKNKTIKSALDDMEYLTGDAEIKRLAELRESSRIDKWFAMSYGRKQGKNLEQLYEDLKELV